MCPRSLVSTAMPTPQPPCSGPSSASAGSSTPVRKTSSNSDPPVIWRSGRTSMPGVAMSIRKNEMPWCFGAAGSVRAMRMPQSLTRPPEHQTFCPSTTKRSPSRIAVVVSEAEVAARARLGEQLAPHLLAPERRPQVALLLRRVTEAEDAAGGQHQADHVEHGRHAGSCALLDPRRLVGRGEAAPAVLDGPVEARPAGLGEAALPGPALLDQLGRADGAVVGRRGRGLVGQPRPGVGPELLDVHRRSLADGPAPGGAGLGEARGRSIRDAGWRAPRRRPGEPCRRAACRAPGRAGRPRRGGSTPRWPRRPGRGRSRPG